MSTDGLPLSGVRVVDLTDGVAGVAPRFLADLGADVILVEPRAGVDSRRAEPMHDGLSLVFASTHANKRGVAVDLGTEGGRDELLRLTDSADLVFESQAVGRLGDLGVGPAVMRERNSDLVVVSLTDFGQTGPYRDYRGGELVTTALSSALTRSGAADREPLLPPGDLARQTAAVSAAYYGLAALRTARQSGVGDYIDLSLFELAAQDLDPGLGMAGTATLGRPITDLPPGRPDVRMMYPILPCADGFVRTFIGAPKQWLALWEWLGRPEEFADDSYQQIATRFKNWTAIRLAVERLFADKTCDEVVEYAAAHGIAMAALNTPAEAMASDHVRERASFVDAEIAPGVTAAVANGFVELDDVRAGFRRRAPELDEHAGARWEGATRAPVDPDGSQTGPRLPLAGLRVLDLGVIVVGAETGRVLADLGADVVKVESRSFKDGARQSDSVERVSRPFSIGNRGKRSVGLNLRSDDGKAAFKRLVAASDVVLTNFKPGTMESLGLGYDELRAVNPAIVMVENSALGSRGPWSKRMGYGPLVRSTVGLTSLWRHPDTDDAFGDDMTIYPDQSAARVGVGAVLAALVGRESTGVGCKIGVAQMEVVFSQLSIGYTRESLEPGTLRPRGNVNEFHAPTGVYPTLGEDGFVAVEVTDDRQWAALAAEMGRADLAVDARYATREARCQHRSEVDDLVAEWTAPQQARAVQDRLQAVGVAAGAAIHAFDLVGDPQLIDRGQFGSIDQPGYPKPLVVHVDPAHSENLATVPLRRAPWMAEHTRDVLVDVAGYTHDEVEALIASGAAEIQEVAAGAARSAEGAGRSSGERDLGE
ncbi:CaiB/BaiF CoA transferase family protein [Gordonia humi]|uniref:Crotonobetainyl-CoA:carnitine CoA-transferase CaiB-like acyl-CoA transferase n=1 Tax=Gordonia humi TaxID=686429 RepID=A0A840EU22_9ACTN|nr:CoA transferase [Gordonia humi]MBB4133834.1 crotonobetainyl-CoA:carnitine CoA-transferase CaiB-like acyl-CoA transferase [Gordonia humi]